MESKLMFHRLTLIALLNSLPVSPEPWRDPNVSSATKTTDSHAFTKVVAYLSNAVLPCYVPELDDANIYPYRWYKESSEIKRDVEEVTSDAQKSDRDLRIQNATTEDSGNYSCHVYTKFGTKEVNVSLIVLASPDAEKAPYFSTVSIFPPQPVSRRKVGSSIEFRCLPEGNPRPRLEWYRNDIPISYTNYSSALIEIRQWSMNLKNLTLKDSGNYSCIAINKLGFINTTFTLEVTDGLQPDLAVFHPLNTTVKYGSSATFQCRVRSEAVPNIQWLKRIDDSSFTKEEHEVLNVQGENFRILRSSEVVKRPDGSYLNKLVIPEAHESDTGKYICLGRNKMGYSFRSAFLTVLPRPRAVTGWSHHVSVHPGDSGNFQVAFPTVHGGLGIALAMAVVGAFYFMCRRRSRGRSDTSTDTGVHRERPNLLPTSIEMDSITKEPHLSLSKTPLICSTSPALSEVELAGSGVTVTKLYENADNCENCYKLRDEV